MNDDPTILDEHRGMAAQQATEIRRRLAEVTADQAALRRRRAELEKFLLAAPAVTWADAAEKARYLITLFATTSLGQDPRRQKLIASVLDDFTRLARGTDDEADRPRVSRRRMAATVLKPYGCIADDEGPSGEALAEALDLIATVARRGLLRLDDGGRIATAFLSRERGWDRVYARRLLDRLVADEWLVSMRRG